jgi:hypothetical protein
MRGFVDRRGRRKNPNTTEDREHCRYSTLFQYDSNSNIIRRKTMKVVGIAVARTGADLNEPIPLTVCNDLSSFGFFQRQVRCRFADWKRTGRKDRSDRCSSPVSLDSYFPYFSPLAPPYSLALPCHIQYNLSADPSCCAAFGAPV